MLLIRGYKAWERDNLCCFGIFYIDMWINRK